MRKSINKLGQILKAIAISIVLVNVANYFYLIDFALTLILFVVISAILTRKFLNETIKPKPVKAIIFYLVIILIAIIFKLYSDSYNSDKSLNDNFYFLVQSGTEDVTIKSDTLVFHFSDTDGFRNSGNMNILEENKIKARDVFYVDYQFRPFNRICIGSIGYKNNKVNDIIEYIGFGIKRIEIFEDQIRLIDNGKEFNFVKINQ